jgi:competence protein ComEC
MRVIIFDVDHGFSAFVKSPTGHTLLIDCGRSSHFDPVDYIIERELQGTVEWNGRALTELLVTHPHDDHIGNIDAVVNKLPPAMLQRQKYDWEGIKRPGARPDEYESLDLYAAWQQTYSFPVAMQPNWGMSIETFCLTPYEAKQLNEPKYVNNSGIVTVLTFAGSRFSEKFLFGADVEEDGWTALLGREAFRKAVYGTDFYIVSHHGHASGFSAELYDAMGSKPFLNLISVTSCDEHVDPRYMSSDFARGATVDGEKRYSLSTRFDGSIVVDVSAEGQFLAHANGPAPNAAADPLLRRW